MREFDRYWPTVQIAAKFVVANRTQYALQVMGDLLQIVVMFFIWRAAYAQADTFGGLTQAEMISYLFVAQVFRLIVSHSIMENQIAHWIRTGDIIKELVVPLVYMWKDLCHAIGWLSAVGGISGGVVYLTGLLFFGVKLPAITALPALLLSLLLAIAISYGISFIIGTFAFWSDGSIWGISNAKQVVMAFASGALIPLSLFPDWLRQVVDWLPFQAGVHIPTSIYLGHLTGAALWRALGVQALWAAGLLLAANWFFHYSLRKVTIPGG